MERKVCTHLAHGLVAFYERGHHPHGAVVNRLLFPVVVLSKDVGGDDGREIPCVHLVAGLFVNSMEG